MKNLWGELPSGEGIVPPVTILKEQAELLTDHYGGMLQGQVSQGEPFGMDLRYNMSIVAPLLNNYTFAVATLYNPITLYPCKLVDRISNAETKANNAAELEIALGRVLMSETVKKVVAALAAQSKV